MLRLLACPQTNKYNEQLQQAHMELQRKHVELHNKHTGYVFNTAAAEDKQQTIEDLQAKVVDLQEELSIVELDRNRYWEDYRQLLLINNRLRQVCLATSASLLVHPYPGCLVHVGLHPSGLSDCLFMCDSLSCTS